MSGHRTRELSQRWYGSCIVVDKMLQLTAGLWYAVVWAASLRAPW
ncbi:MAG: hypothetical protein ABGZ23_17635 [Fuerstiella sp.]